MSRPNRRSPRGSLLNRRLCPRSQSVLSRIHKQSLVCTKRVDAFGEFRARLTSNITPATCTAAYVCVCVCISVDIKSRSRRIFLNHTRKRDKHARSKYTSHVIRLNRALLDFYSVRVLKRDLRSLTLRIIMHADYIPPLEQLREQ